MKQIKILIVDDISTNIQIIGSVLKNTGYNLSFAQSGKSALHQTANENYDLILLDIMMPEMSGYEVCELLKANPKTADIPIIFITAKDDVNSITHGFDVGGTDYITKPFNAQELIVRVENQLKIRLQKQLLQLQADELSDLNAMKDLFLSILAHDLKNPIGGLVTLLNQLQKGIEEMEIERSKKLISVAGKASVKVYDLLEHLLLWSRSISNKIDVVKMQSDAQTIVNEQLYIHRETAEKKSIKLISHIKPNSYIFADNYMISMVLRNLITNAIKFSHTGSTVIVKYDLINENTCQITVADTGIGISETDQERLFRIDKKFSLRGTANEEGSGIGLILCKELIEKNNGKIRIHSTIGHGSEFIFTLPIHK